MLSETIGKLTGKKPGGKANNKLKIICLSLSAGLFMLFGFQLWLHINSTSPTFDEPLHTLAGYRYWQCGNYALNPEHPPLLKLLATLPISAEKFNEPALPCDQKISYKLEGFTIGAQFLARNNIDSISRRTRLAASLMSLLLAVLVFLAANEMFGLIEATLALAILAFEPMLIAHGSLVTTDMAITATSFAAVYALYRYGRKPDAARLLFAGLAIGAMVASKHTAVVIMPLLLILLLIDIFIFRAGVLPANSASILKLALRRLGAFVLMGVIGLAVLWACYGFRYQALPASSPQTISLADVFNMGYHHEAIETTAGKLVNLLQQSHLVPESYTLGLADIVGSGSRPTFLLGTAYPTGQWFYFPVAFVIKSSAVLLILLFVSLFYLPIYKKYSREMLYLLIPALGYLAVSLSFGLNIGIRHVLPIYPFFIVIAAAGAGALCRRYRFFIVIVALLLIFHAGEAARTVPNYIAFANDFWGGSNNAYHLLDDSNVEWSQNFKLIGNYVEQNDVRNCYLSGLGLGEIVRRYQPCQIMPGGFILNSPEQVNEPLPETIEGTIFISTAVITPTIGAEFEPFFKTTPKAILGGSILVFEGRYEIPALAARSRIERAAQLTELKRFDEALVDAQAAVRLTPNDPRAHLSVGTILAKSNQNTEARQELTETIRLTQASQAQEAIKAAAQQLLGQLP